MSYSKPSQCFDIALFGMKPEFKNKIGNAILKNYNAFTRTVKNFDVQQNHSFRVIRTPDFFNEECQNPDQMNIDFMAHSFDGLHLFILAVDSENSQTEVVVDQIDKLQNIFGENVTKHLVVISEEVKSYNSLRQVEEMFKIPLAPLNDKLASQCENWCAECPLFHYDYKDYSYKVVKRRREHLKRPSDPRGSSRNKHPPQKYPRIPGGNPPSPSTSQRPMPEHNIGRMGMPGDTFSIVLLGQTGTGKSASANTILAAGNPHLDQSQLFKTEPSSTPVTIKCEVRKLEKFGSSVRVVDTPDFFYEDEYSQATVDECKRYCRPGQCVVLLVIQLGRFTEGEWGILERLEEVLGWKIRESTIVLLTHGDDFKDHTEKFIGERSHLRHIVEACRDRYHVFKNNSRDTKQVTELIKKIPDYQRLFPNFTEKSSMPECSLC